MAAVRGPYVTEAEYLAYDLAHEGKHEYIPGEIIAMAGGSERHEVLIGNVIRLLGNALSGRPCRVYGSGLRVKTDDTGLYAYPDVTVVCGPSRVLGTNPVTLTNPLVIVEVLSESTERYDRGAKFAHYRHLASLRNYVLASTDEARVEVYTRNDDGTWTLAEAVAGGSVRLPAIDVTLELPAVYEGFDAIDDTVTVNADDEPVG